MELSRSSQHGEGGKVDIVLDLVREKFTTQDGHAFLQYKLRPATAPEGKQVMDIQHTYVPSFMRGSGMAGLLCQAAFTHARECDLLVLPTCSYVSVRIHPRPSLSIQSLIRRNHE